MERLRQQTKNTGREIHFDLNTSISIPQEKFLSNSRNKNKFIILLTRSLNQASFSCKVADEDADISISSSTYMLIVESVIHLATNGSRVVLVNQDIDLLVLLSQKTSENTTAYLKKKKIKKKRQTVGTIITVFDSKIKEIRCVLTCRNRL